MISPTWLKYLSFQAAWLTAKAIQNSSATLKRSASVRLNPPRFQHRASVQPLNPSSVAFGECQGDLEPSFASKD